MPIYKFKCEDGHITEKDWEEDTEDIMPSKCTKIPCPYPYENLGTAQDNLAICAKEAHKIKE